MFRKLKSRLTSLLRVGTCSQVVNIPRLEELASEPLAYTWLNRRVFDYLKANSSVWRPNYAWGLLHAAYLSHVLGRQSFSAIEFGVAGGNGLIAMEAVVPTIEKVFEVEVHIYGLDSGSGLPKAQDYRDLPNLWPESAYPMDETKLRSRLTRAQVRLGLVSETVPKLLAEITSPIGFISFDLDLYSSTRDAFGVLETQTDSLMPRVYCYFDDIMGYTCAPFNGERLAIAEFNEGHENRKLSPIFGLRYYLGKPHVNSSWPDKMYLAHALDHPSYNKPDGYVLSGRMDLLER